MQESLRSSRGFTLLEVLVVVFLIGIIYAALVPGAFTRSGIDPALNRLVSELRYTAQLATATGVVHRLTIDLTQQRMRIERREEQETEPKRLPGSASLLDLKPPRRFGEFVPIQQNDGDWHTLEANDVQIASVQIGDETYDEELAFIGFAGEGGSDPAVIRLVDSTGFEEVIRVLSFTGEIRFKEDLID